MNILKKIDEFNNDENRFILLLISVGFLLTAPFFSGISFFILLLLSPKKNIRYYINNPWSIYLLLCSVLMIIFTFVHANNGLRENPSLNWIGLVNWLPYFYCFFAFQNYLNSSKRRRIVLITFLCGSIPLLITGFGQVWFNWHGPMSIFNGAIIWYQRSLGNGTIKKGLSGLFNNANYAGNWLVIMLPICIACFNETKSKLKKGTAGIFTLSILIAIYLTKSRNALLGIFMTLPFTIFWYTMVLVIPILIFLFFGFIFPSNFQSTLRALIPKSIFNNLSNWGLSDLSQYPRFIIWSNSFEFILEEPLIGWGAASFPILFEQKQNLWRGHSHNIFFELSISYGLIVSFLLTIFVVALLIKSFKKIYLIKRDSNYFDNAWWAASLALIISQLFDVQYFDFRISMMFWLLLSGLLSIVQEKYKTHKIPLTLKYKDST